MENSPVYIFFKDDHIRSRRLSRNFEKMLGRPISELLGKTMDELFPSDFPFVRDAVQFALSGSSVSCRFDIESDLWQSDFDSNQMGQVIDNIVINAHQAMPNGGTIDDQARNVELAETESPILPKGKYVRVSVRDSGIGIPKECLSRIFDPFFTTKPQGHGLGLSTCYSIVTRHGGCINVESEPGQGSVFHVLLPACDSAYVADATKAKTTHTGSGVFVVMDDERVIRDAIGKMLKSFCYTPILVNSGQQAIDYLLAELQASRKVVGMMFDLTVPGEMGGKDAAVEVRRICPDIPIFVASGYADDPVMAQPGKFHFNASICKPFVRDDLARLLNTHLHSRP